MRLIDADEVVKKINEIYKGYMTEEYGSTPSDFEAIVDKTPTAYDIDKVVEELEKAIIPDERITYNYGLKKSIEIVKQGVR